MAFPRTGSSMTAGILAKHGIWTGDYRSGDKINQKGHFENLNFKRLVRAHKKTKIHVNGPFPADKEFLTEFLSSNPVEPWLIKGSAMYWKLFEELNPKYICVRRDKDSCMKSCKNVGLYFDGMEKSFDRHMSELDFLVEDKAGVNVYTDQIINGDFSSLEEAFDLIHIKFDPNKASEFVDRKLWHYES
jgi:hypothetical protein